MGEKKNTSERIEGPDRAAIQSASLVHDADVDKKYFCDLHESVGVLIETCVAIRSDASHRIGFFFVVVIFFFFFSTGF